MDINENELLQYHIDKLKIILFNTSAIFYNIYIKNTPYFRFNI